MAACRAAPHSTGGMVQLTKDHVMDRRTFMALVSGGLFVAPLAAEAQQAGSRTVTIGYLGNSSPSLESKQVEAFRWGYVSSATSRGRISSSSTSGLRDSRSVLRSSPP